MRGAIYLIVNISTSSRRPVHMYDICEEVDQQLKSLRSTNRSKHFKLLTSGLLGKMQGPTANQAPGPPLGHFVQRSFKL